MGLVLLVVIWLITLVSTYFFIAKTWWLPTGASAAAAGIDHHFATTYFLMGIVFVALALVSRHVPRSSAVAAAHAGPVVSR